VDSNSQTGFGGIAADPRMTVLNPALRVSKLKRCLLVLCSTAALMLQPLCGFTAASGPATVDVGRVFEDANRLYEQGRFSEAAAAYERLVQDGRASAAIYYNLGNAWFKSGQNGRAVAAYRQAERLTPRDPNVRFNLQFVRKKISGDERDRRTTWERVLTNLTVNEWTWMATTAYWLCFVLLALRELRPALRRSLRTTTVVTGLATVLLIGCVVAAVQRATSAHDAVVVVPNAVVRRSPLEESAVSYQLPDGSEVTVLDAKESAVGDRKQLWLQVRDQHGIGWLQRDQVILLQSPNAPPGFSPGSAPALSSR